MATTAIDFAPVLTPQTLGVLADNFERSNVPEKALFLRKLLPFVHGLVERCFFPLTTPARKNSLESRFTRLARDFEPYRIYFNIRLLSTLGNQWFLDLYPQFLVELLELRLKTARDMGMSPDLIFTAIHDYMQILRAFVRHTIAPAPQGNEPTLEQITDSIHLLHASTRFDYGLTAVFLVLERSIPDPAPADKRALLFAFQKGLLDFARATAKVVVDENVRHALHDLKTRHIEIAPVGEEFQVESSRALHQGLDKPLLGFSPRQAEMNWLTRNKDLSSRYGGQWIVLEKDELVANDEDYRKAREVATRRGIKRPFIIFVPVKGTGGFMGI